MMYSLFLSCPRGMEYILEEEVKGLGFQVDRISPQGVYGQASLELAYHLCLWSRIANRVQWVLFQGEAQNEKSIYSLCRRHDWSGLFSADKTFAIEFHGTSFGINNTMYGAMLVKDAIVDHFREQEGSRPSVDKENPDIKIHAYLHREQLTVSVDLTGFSLHQRGYRKAQGQAPLKENVASALLYRSKWPDMVKKDASLCDPFCGSGTLVIEAAMMACNMAPGLLRDDQSLKYLKSFDASLWQKVRQDAAEAQVKPKAIFYGSDYDARMITYAKENAKRAGVMEYVHFSVQDMKNVRPKSPHGLWICNPPYGERLGEVSLLLPMYQEMGVVLHSHFKGWNAGVLTQNPLLAKAMGLRAQKQYTIYNGANECKFFTFSLDEDNKLKSFQEASLSEGAQMFYNRLKKNLQHLKKWAQREHITCYRVYDADLPEYAFAIDVYEDYAVISEYVPPKTIPEHKAEQRALEVSQLVPKVLDIAPNHVFMKRRERQKGRAQYEKLGTKSKEIIVTEGRAKFKLNLSDYLDTGLFLDHRPLRMRFDKLKQNTRFLNLFAYTATASVHAALAGAFTTSVDLSKTYLLMAEENFKLNHLSVKRHTLIHADCFSWLQDAKGEYDVIFMDPPSFSNSKRMEGVLDIQRDHVSLIEKAMNLLSDNGILYFSTNLRQFKLEAALLAQFDIVNITEKTIDLDFKRNTKIHQCFEIKHKK